MFRSTRYFGKNDGKHNLFGEIEYVEDWGLNEEDNASADPVPPDPEQDDEE